MRRKVPTALPVLLLLGTLLAVPVAGSSASTGSQSSAATASILPDQQRVTPGEQVGVSSGELTAISSTDSSALNVSYTYRRVPDQPAVVGVTMSLPVTASVDRAVVEFRDDVTVVDTENVDHDGSGYEWDGDSDATIVYHLPFDWKYTGNRADSWTLLEHRPPSIETSTAVTVREQIDAVDGYVGNRTLLLGAYEVYDRQANGERIELVVPEGVGLLYGPNRTVDALANASRALRVGGRDPVVHAFTTPEIENDVVPFVQPGFALDDRTLLVDADSEMDVWTHEYVHTRQAFPRTEGLTWLVEGSAEYYGWLLSIRQGYDGWAPLQQVFRQARNDDSILAEPDTLSGESDYNKGGHVLAVLDREIRAATDGQQTLQDAFRRVNRDNVTLETFLESIREVGGPDVTDTADRYFTTTASPNYQPGSDQLEAVYEYTAPQIGVRIRAISTTGTNWTRSLDSQDRRLAVGLSETVRITGQITNEGDASGVGALAPQVSATEGRLARVDDPWVGNVGPNESVVRTATHQFNRPGTYEMSHYGLSYTVRVVPERETTVVTDLSVVDTEPPTDQVTVEATVRNDGARSTFVTLPVRRDGQRVSTTAFVLDEDANRTVTVERNLSARAPVTLTVGTVSTKIGQPDPTNSTSKPDTETDVETDTPRESTTTDTPDSLFVASVAGVVLAVLLSIAATLRGDEPE